MNPPDPTSYTLVAFLAAFAWIWLGCFMRQMDLNIWPTNQRQMDLNICATDDREMGASS